MKKQSKEPSRINIFLERIKHLIPFERKLKNSVIDALQLHLSIVIDKKHVSFQGKHIFITTSSLVKIKIKQNEQKILETINSNLDNKNYFTRVL